MILNAARQTVERFRASGAEEALCPDCQARLVVRLCELKRSHFAHYPLAEGERRKCVHEETEWHLAWKFAFLDLGGWEIEVGLEGVDVAYRADAYNAEKRKVREFVHSLSPYYLEKHRTLLGAGYDVFWLMDGHAFQSAHLERFTCRNGKVAIRHLLKPRARDLVEELHPHVRAHYDGALWQPGDDKRYWFEVTEPRITRLLELYKSHTVTT